MKRLFYSFALAIAAISGISCNKTEQDVNTPKDELKEVVLTFSSQKPNLLNENGTKTAWNANAHAIYWSTTDKIRVAIKVGDNWQNADGDATSDKGPKLYESNQAGSNSDLVEFQVPTYFKTTASGTYKFYGIYPSSCTGTDANYTYMPSLNVSIPAEQTPNAGTFDPSADIMVAESEGDYTGIPNDKVIALNWTRLVAHGDITLKKLPTFEDDEVIRSITLTAQDGADLVGEHYLNLVSGVFSLPSNATAVNSIKIKASGNNLAKNSDGNIEFWFASRPFTASSLTAVITTNKYVYTKTYSEISKTFAANTRNVLGISMSNCSKTDAPAEQLIPDGNYVISTTYENSDLMMVANTGSGNYQNYATLSTNVENGKIVVTPEAAWQISFDANNACYYIQNVGTETKLTGGAGSSNLTLSADGAKFYIVESGNGYHICTSGNDPRWIGYNYNGGAGRFALYKDDTQYPGVVSIAPAKVNALPVLEIANITLGNNAAVTEPVIITPTVKKYITSITVNGVFNEAACSSNASWLSVSYTNGNLVYTAEANDGSTERIAYVSVKGSNDNGNTENVVFSVTQPPYVSYKNKWVLVTNVNELAVDDKIIIVNTGVTLAMSTTQNNNNRGSVAVSENTSDDKIVDLTNADATQQLTLGKTNNHWTLYTGSGYLYAASSGSNHLKTQVTNDANGEWSITIDPTTYVASITAQGSNTRNQLKNNGEIFSCYASGQTAVKIYKWHEDPDAPKLSVSPATTSEGPAAWPADNNEPKTFTVTPTNGTWNYDATDVESWVNITSNGNNLTVTPKTAQASEAHSGSITITLTPSNSGYSDETVMIYLSQAKYDGGGNPKTSTLTFNAACGGSGTADDGAEWTVTSDANESTYDSTKGVHYGTGKAAVSYLTLSTSDISGTITKIEVNASGASGTSAKLNVTVGGSAFGSEQSLTASATNYTLTGSASGAIVVSLTQTSATKALYVKSITVTYN